ncbi:MAG: hypothetical protein OXN17_06965 [Candidatus Poribacteria bacterium]|nr:hypothetical protein [Candidatus Poribacteria bacterium]
MKARRCRIVVTPRFQQEIDDARPKALITRAGGFVYETTALYITDIALRLHCCTIFVRFNALE